MKLLNLLYTPPPPRKVTVALRDRLKEELDKLVREKVTTLFTEPTNWVSFLVLVNKR